MISRRFRPVVGLLVVGLLAVAVFSQPATGPATRRTFEQAAALPVDKEIQATISPAGDQHYYIFMLDAPARVRVTATAVPVLNLQAVIYDEQRRQLAQSTAGPGRDLLLMADLRKGRYFLYIRDAAHSEFGSYHSADRGESSTPYRLKLHAGYIADPFKPNHDPAAAGAIEIGRSYDTCIFPTSDRSYFRVKLPAGARGELRLSTIQVPENLAVLARAFVENREIASLQSPTGKIGVLRFTIDKGGDYLFSLEDSGYWDGRHGRGADDSTLPVRFKVEFLDTQDPYEPNGDFDHTTPLALNKPLKATLFPGGDQDFYKFTVPQETRGMLRLDLAGLPDSLSPELTLYAADRRAIRQAHSDHGQAVVLRQPVTAGDYFLCVTNRTIHNGVDYEHWDRIGSRTPYTLTAVYAPIGEPGKMNFSAQSAQPLVMGQSRSCGLIPENTPQFFSLTLKEDDCDLVQAVVTGLNSRLAARLDLMDDKQRGLATTPALADGSLVTTYALGPGTFYVVLSPVSVHNGRYYEPGEDQYQSQPVQVAMLPLYRTGATIDAGPHHLGNNKRDDFKKPEAEGRSFAKTFDVRDPAEHDVLLISVRSLPRDMEADRVVSLTVNGKPVAVLNQYVEWWDYWRTFPIDLPAGTLKAGSNELTIRMGDRTDDFEFRKLALGKRLCYRVTDKGIVPATRAELGAVADATADNRAGKTPLKARPLQFGVPNELRLDQPGPHRNIDGAPGESRWFRIDAKDRCIDRFLLPGPHFGIEPQATLYRVEGNSEQPLPRVLYLRGPSDRTDLTNLHAGIDFVRIDADSKQAPAALLLPDELAKYDAILIDNLTDQTQFDFASERVQANLQKFCEGGKRVLLVDPCCPLDKMGIKLGGIRDHRPNATVDLATTDPLFAGERGSALGWSDVSNGARIESWKESGLTPLAMDLTEAEKFAVTAYKPAGKGAIIVETMLLGHPANYPKAQARLQWLLGLKTRLSFVGETRRMCDQMLEESGRVFTTRAMESGTYLLHVRRIAGVAASPQPMLLYAHSLPLSGGPRSPGATIDSAIEIAPSDKPVSLAARIDEPGAQRWYRLTTSRKQGAVIRVECPEEIDAAIDLYRAPAKSTGTRILYLAGPWDGYVLDQRLPDIAIDRVNCREAQASRILLDAAKLSKYDAIFVEGVDDPQWFGLDQKPVLAAVDAYVRGGGRFILDACTELLGVKRDGPNGGRARSFYAGDSPEWFTSYAGPLGSLAYGSDHGNDNGAISIPGSQGYSALFRHADKPTEWASCVFKKVEKGCYIIDSQRIGCYDTPGADWKLYFYLGCQGLGTGTRIDNTFGRNFGSPEQWVLPAEDAQWVFRLADRSAVHWSSEPLAVTVDWELRGDAGPQVATAITPLALGKTVSGRLHPSGWRDTWRIQLEKTGLARFSAEHPADNVDLEMSLIREDAPPRKVLVLRGGRRDDYNLARRPLAKTQFTQVDANDARTWLDRMTQFDAVVAESLTNPVQFGLDRPETQAAVLKYVEGGGNFVLLCPQGEDFGKVPLWGAKFVPTWRKGTLAIADAAHPLHGRQASGQLGGWHPETSDSSGFFDGWKEAGFQCVYWDNSDKGKEKYAALAVKSAGKGLLILDALEATHRYHEGANWHLANLLDASLETLLDVRNRGQGNVPRLEDRLLKAGSYLLTIADSRHHGNYIHTSQTPYSLRVDLADVGEFTDEELIQAATEKGGAPAPVAAEPSSTAIDLLPGTPASVRMWPEGRVWWYRLALPSPGKAILSLTDVPDGVDPVMEIYRAGDLKTPWQRIDGSCGRGYGGPERFGFDAGRSENLYVKIYDRENFRTSFSPMKLQFDFAPVLRAYANNSDAQSAIPLVPGHAYYLNLFPGRDANYFKIQVADKSAFQATCTGVPANLALRIEVQPAKATDELRWFSLAGEGKKGADVSAKGEVTKAGVYYVIVRPGYDCGLSTDTFTFKADFKSAAAAEPPVVTARFPATQVSGCAPDAPIVLAFSKPLKANGIDRCLSVTGSKTGQVAGKVSLDDQRNLLVFRPSAPLTAGETVNVSVGGVVDVEGRAMAGKSDGSFAIGTPHLAETVIRVVLARPRLSAGKHTIELTPSLALQGAPQITCKLADGSSAPVTDVQLQKDGSWHGTLAITATAAGGPAKLEITASDYLNRRVTRFAGVSTFEIATQPPPAMAVVALEQRSSGRIGVSWSPPPGAANLAGFRIYRATKENAADNERTLAQEISNPQSTRCEDQPPADGDYFYTIAAVDDAGNVGPMSPAVRGTSLRIGPKTAVDQFAAAVEHEKVTLSWKKSADPKAVGYSIYRVAKKEDVDKIDLARPYRQMALGDQATLDTPGDGQFIYVIAARDAGDNVGPLSPAVIAVVDTQQARATITSADGPEFSVGDHALVIKLNKKLKDQLKVTATFSDRKQRQFTATRAGATDETTWSVTLSTAAADPDGDVYLALDGEDLFGNKGVAIDGPSSVYFNNVPPRVRIYTDPRGKFKSGKVQVTLAFAKPVVGEPTCQYSVAGKSFPLKLAKVRDGVYSGVMELAPDSPNGPAQFIVSATDQFKHTGATYEEGQDFVILTTTPEPPTALKAKPARDGAVEVRWLPPATPNVAFYRLYAGPTADFAVGPPALAQNEIHELYVSYKPKQSQVTFVRATAVDAAGNESKPSDAIRAEVDTTPPEAPTDVLAAAQKDGQVRITWKTDSIKKEVRFLVFRATGDNIDPAKDRPIATVSELETIDRPGGAASYSYFIVAEDLVGNQSKPARSNVLAYDFTAATAAIALGPTHGTMPWSPDGYHLLQLPIIGAGKFPVQIRFSKPLAEMPTLRYRTRLQESPRDIALKSQGNEYSGLIEVAAGKEDGLLEFIVSSKDAAGNVGRTFTEGERFWITTIAPKPPDRITVERRPLGKVLVSWNIPAGQQINCLSFDLYRSRQPVKTVEGLKPIARIQKDVSFLDSPAEEGAYHYALVAEDLGGNRSSVSASVSAVSAATPPPAPKALRASVDRQIALTWQPAGAADIRYRIYRATGAAAVDAKQRIVDDWSDPGFSDLPQSDGTYQYLVTSVDPSGNESSPSNVVSVEFVGKLPRVALTALPAGPVRDAVKLTLTSTLPLVEPPQLFLAVGSRNDAIQLRPTGTDGKTWAGSYEVVPGCPNGPARFSFRGVAAGGVTATALSSADAVIIDTQAPTARVSLSRPSPLAVGEHKVTLSVSKSLTTQPVLTLKTLGATPRQIALQQAGPQQYAGPFTITRDDHDGKAIFSFVGVDLAGNEARIEQVGEFVVDNNGPKSVTDLKAASAQGGAVQLSWQPPVYRADERLTAISGYNIYRSEKPITAVEPLTPIAANVAGAGYSDRPLQDGDYHYAVVSVAASGMMSVPSPSVAGHSVRAAPPAPRVTDLKQLPTGLAIAWEDDVVAAKLRFRVLLSKDQGEAVEIAKDLADPKLSHELMEDGVYTVRVVAADLLGNESPPSLPRSLPYQQLAPVATLSFPKPPPWGEGSYEINLTLNRAAAAAPTLALVAGEKRIPIALTGAGARWTGKVAIDRAIGAEQAEFQFKAVVSEKGQNLEGTGIVKGRKVALDFTPPTIALHFAPGTGMRDRQLLLKTGTFEFTIESSKPLLQAPKLTFTPQGQPTVTMNLSPVDPRHWTSSLTIDDKVSDTGLFEAEAVDLCGNTGKGITEGQNVLLLTAPPGSVPRFRAIAEPGGKVRLDWTPPILASGRANAHANRFRVYRSDSKITAIESMVPIASIERTLGFVDKPDRDQDYYYTVCAIDDAGNVGAPADCVSVHVDKNPPAPPRDLVASELSTGVVKLMWKAPQGKKATFYRVYLEKFPITQIAGLHPMADMVPFTEIYGSPNDNGKYYFAVTAVDDALNESAPSQPVFVEYKSVAPMAFMAIFPGNNPPDAMGTFVIQTSEPLSGAPQLLVKPPATQPSKVRLTGSESNWSARFSPAALFKPQSGPEQTYALELSTPAPLTSPPRLVYHPEGQASQNLDFRGSGQKFAAEIKPRQFFRLDNRLWLSDGVYTVTIATTEPLKQAPKLIIHSEHGQKRTLTCAGSAEFYQAALKIDATWPDGQYGFEFEGTDVNGNVGTEIREGPLFRVKRTAPKPPEKVSVVQAEQSAPGAVGVRWSPPQAAGDEVPYFYKVYRASQKFDRLAEAEMVQLFRVTEEGRDQETVLDMPPSNGQWFYRVTALDQARNESEPSALVDIRVFSKVPVAEILVFTRESGDSPTQLLGPGEGRIVVTTNTPLARPPEVSWLLKPNPKDKHKIELTGGNSRFEGVFKLSLEAGFEQDGEFEFSGTSAEGATGTSIRLGKSFTATTIGPEARIIIPSVYEMKVAVKPEGGGELKVPPVQAGRIRVNVELRQPASDVPQLSYVIDGEKGRPPVAVPLSGFGRNWYGFMDIPAGIVGGKGRFVFRAVDTAGNVSTKITRREYPRETDESPIPRTLRNFATTGGEFEVQSVPPYPPKNVTLTARKLGVTEARWDAPQDGAWAYNLYRSLAPIVGKPPGPPVKSNILARCMVDDPPVDANYFYAVTSLDLAGNESDVSESPSVFIHTIKPELKIKAVPSGEDFVILFPEEEPGAAEITLRFPGQKDYTVDLGGDSGKLLKRVTHYENGRPVQGIVLPRQAEFFNGKVEVIVHSPDPEGNRVEAITETDFHKITSATGGSVSSSDGAARLEIPPGLQPVIPTGPKESKRVKGYDQLYFISYERIPDTPAQAAAAQDPRVPDPIPPQVEVVGVPYTIHMNDAPMEPIELKAAVTQADLSQLQALKPKLTMKIPEVYSDAVRDPEYLKSRLKVLRWAPDTSGSTKRRGNWELVPDIEIKPGTGEIVAPADKITTYVIVSEHTPPTIREAKPDPDGAVGELRPAISALIVDKGVGVGIGPDHPLMLAIDGQAADSALIQLSKDDPTEVRLTYTPANPLGPGDHLISLRAEDVVGNVANFQWRFSISSQPPIMGRLTPEDGSTVAVQRPVISAVFSGQAGIDAGGISLSIDGDSASTDSLHYDQASGLFTWICPRDLPSGEHQARLTVRDRTNQTSEKSWSFIVACDPPDLNPPVVENGQLRIRVVPHYCKMPASGLRLSIMSRTIPLGSAGQNGFSFNESRGELSMPLPAEFQSAPFEVRLVAQDELGNAAAKGWRAGAGMTAVDLDTGLAALTPKPFAALARHAPAAPVAAATPVSHRTRLWVGIALIAGAVVLWSFVLWLLFGRKTGIWAAIGRDLRSTRRFLAARTESHSLAHKRVALDAELSAAYEQLGTSAEQAHVLSDLEPSVQLVACRRQISATQADLASRQAVHQKALAALEKQIADDAAAIAEARNSRSAADSSAEQVEAELAQARGKLASVDKQIHSEQDRLAKLGSAAQATDPTESLASQRSQLDTQCQALKSDLTAAEKAARQSASAAKGAVDEARKASKGWQSTSARLQKDLASAEALTTGERASAVDAAKSRLADEKSTHEQAAAVLESRQRQLETAARADADQVEAVGRQLHAATDNLASVQNSLTAREIQSHLAALQAQRSAALAAIAQIEPRVSDALAQAQARAAELQKAQERARESKAQGEAATAAAAADLQAAQAAAESATAALPAALRALGKAVHDQPQRPPALEQPDSCVARLIADIKTIDDRTAELRREMDSTQSSKRRIVVLALATVLAASTAAAGIWLVAARPPKLAGVQQTKQPALSLRGIPPVSSRIGMPPSTVSNRL